MAQEAVFSIVWMTPERAEYLTQNVANPARVDSRLVLTYSKDMAAGLWKLNGEPIILSKTGKVLSGRLRLHACVKAGKSFPTLLVENIDESFFETIDSVRRRTMGDILTIRKEKHGRALAAALSHVWQLANDTMAGKPKKASAQQMLTILDANPDLRLSLTLTRDVHPLLPHGLAGALHFVFSRIDANLSDRFFQELVDPIEQNGRPTYMLFRQLKASEEGGGARNIPLVAALTIKAWEAFRKSQNIGVLKYAASEQFPKISELPEQLRFDGLSRDVSQAVGEASLHQELAHLHGITVEMCTVTPELAADFLSRNSGNRSIASAVVDRYARDMKTNNWVLNGQTLKFGVSGRLLDGQHRCAAAVKSQRGFPAIVVRGLDDSVFDTFDLGAKRSIGALLDRKGEINTSTLAAALRQAWLINEGLIQQRSVSPTISELFAYLDQNPGIRESVRKSHRIRDVVAPAIGCAFHYVFSRISAEKADEFIDRLGDGVELSKENSVWHLRDRLIKDKASRKRSMSDSEKAALIIKAWNSFLMGERIKHLKWQDAGPRKEEFPSILGQPVGNNRIAA